MVVATRVGNMLVLEYFSEEQQRILNGRELNAGEEEEHFRMLYERDRAFDEIRQTYVQMKPSEQDPLGLECRKYRNENSLNNPFLRR